MPTNTLDTPHPQNRPRVFSRVVDAPDRAIA